MITRRARLMATLRGEPVDRPPVSFYEINGLEPVDDRDPYNIFNDPSWRPLVELARDRTDRIVMRGAAFRDVVPDPVDELAVIETRERDNARFSVKRVRVGKRILTARTRRDRDVNTTWHEEHLLKDTEDLKVFLELPPQMATGSVDTAPFLALEKKLGDTGIVMVDMADPLCLAAGLFDMASFTIIALTEEALFRRLLDRYAAFLHPIAAKVAEALPGRLWRIVGPEYASAPYLPPHLFRAYVTEYDRPMVAAVLKHGGFPRIHCHGHLRANLQNLADTGCVGLDPVEPPPQGDVELAFVRAEVGRQMVLFGNLEASDIENLPTPRFAEKIKRALDEGTRGEGRGFVLMPSACPYGRVLPPLALANYRMMVEMVEKL
ncbi:MAG: uroporphyrinogen decarboxylase family protein [Planctomycetota bacterium]